MVLWGGKLFKISILYLENTGFRYCFWMRVCSGLRAAKWLFPIRAMAELRLSLISHRSGIQIPSSTKIGKGFYIGHFGTMVISGGTVIGNNVNISPGLNIGRANRGERKGYPVIGDKVYIGPGVKIVGAVKIGNNVAIGANAVVTKDVPDNAVVVGIPAKVISYAGADGYMNKTNQYVFKPMVDNLNKKIANATKWSAITEVMAKLVAPISSMVLARLLTPEAFGVVATLNMVIAFAEIFTDAGFQRYLIQHEFEDEEDKDKSTNVAFWSNLVMSFVLWGVIAIFSEPLATLVGNPGLGHVLTIACVSIPLAAFSSIQMALFKRSFDFKTLFWRRLAMVLVPLFVTIPLAFWLRNYWALVIGTIVINLVNALLLTFKSNWRPRRYYSFSRLKDMFSFCSWSIVDSVLVWATAYVDIFFIGRALNSYYLGVYKTSISTVGHFTALITASVLPVIMPSLSRLQNDLPEMRSTLLKFQKYTSVLLLPLGVGIFMFKDLITDVMLGGQWTEAAPFIGLWGLMEVTTVIFSRFCSPVYPAIGKPRTSVIVQILHLVVLIPAVIISGQYGFRALYITRSLVRLELVLVNLIFVYVLIKQSPWKMFINILPEICSCLVMAVVAFVLLRLNNSMALSFVWVVVCAAVYFATLYMFPKDRAIILSLKGKALSTIKKKK